MYYYSSDSLKKDAQFLVRKHSKELGFKVKLSYWSIGLPSSSDPMGTTHLLVAYCGINPVNGDTVGGQLTMAI